MIFDSTVLIRISEANPLGTSQTGKPTLFEQSGFFSANKVKYLAF